MESKTYERDDDNYNISRQIFRKQKISGSVKYSAVKLSVSGHADIIA